MKEERMCLRTYDSTIMNLYQIKPVYIEECKE